MPNTYLVTTNFGQCTNPERITAVKITHKYHTKKSVTTKVTAFLVLIVTLNNLII